MHDHTTLLITTARTHIFLTHVVYSIVYSAILHSSKQQSLACTPHFVSNTQILSLSNACSVATLQVSAHALLYINKAVAGSGTCVRQTACKRTIRSPKRQEILRPRVLGYDDQITHKSNHTYIHNKNCGISRL